MQSLYFNDYYVIEINCVFVNEEQDKWKNKIKRNNPERHEVMA